MREQEARKYVSDTCTESSGLWSEQENRTTVSQSGQRTTQYSHLIGWYYFAWKVLTGMNESRRFTLKVLCAVRYLKNYLIWDCSTNLNVTFVTFTYQKNKSQLSLFFYCKAFSSSVVFEKLELEDCAVFRVKYLKPSDYHDFYPFPLFYKSKQTKKTFWIKEENLSWVVLTGWAEVVQFWFWSHEETSAETNLQLRNHLYVRGELYSASEPCESLQESSCLVFASVHKICAALG